MDDKNITLQHLSIVLERISKHISNNFAPAVHVHGSNEITGMSGYVMAEEENQGLHLVLSSGDSLNKAIGKLERSVANIAYKIETEIANHLHDDIFKAPPGAQVIDVQIFTNQKVYPNWKKLLFRI